MRPWLPECCWRRVTQRVRWHRQPPVVVILVQDRHHLRHRQRWLAEGLRALRQSGQFRAGQRLGRLESITIKVGKSGFLDAILKYRLKLASAEAGAKVGRSNCQLGSRPFSQLRRVSKRESVMVDSYNKAGLDL